jgi:hypothetical protein
VAKGEAHRLAAAPWRLVERARTERCLDLLPDRGQVDAERLQRLGVQVPGGSGDDPDQGLTYLVVVNTMQPQASR